MAVCFECNIKNKLSFCKLISLGVKVLGLLGRCFFKTFFLITNYKLKKNQARRLIVNYNKMIIID